MSDNKTKTASDGFPFRKTFDLIGDYFVKSDEKLVAWLMVAGVVLCIVGLVVLMFLLAMGSTGLWAAMAAKAATPFLISLGQFALTIAAYVGINALKEFLIDALTIRWTRWLTVQTVNSLLPDNDSDKNNYIDVSRFSKDGDNISQIIQADTENFVTLTLDLGADFLKSVLSLGTFVGNLWVTGGALSFVLAGFSIIIPGYLVWTALLVAVIASVATHFIGKGLAALNKEAENVRANVRKNTDTVLIKADNIGQEHGKKYYKGVILEANEASAAIGWKKLRIDTQVSAFQNFYTYLVGILPMLLSAPLYFTGLIELDQLMQISFSFQEVNTSLSWFVNAYDKLAKYGTSIRRITDLHQRFEKDGLPSNPKGIGVRAEKRDDLNIEVNIMPPQATSKDTNGKYIMRNLALNLKKGEHTLIKAPSGTGKSTLFKAIAGIWAYGDGTISIPLGKKMYVLPQRPTLPDLDLRGVLAYSDALEKEDKNYTLEECAAALKAVGMEAFVPKLQEKLNWEKVFSPGMQQQISIARALLKKPDWLFLDEATASLDEENEEMLYYAITGRCALYQMSELPQNFDQAQYQKQYKKSFIFLKEKGELYYITRNGTLNKQEKFKDDTLLNSGLDKLPKTIVDETVTRYELDAAQIEEWITSKEGRAVKHRLKDTTIVSIAHRSTVEKYHSRIAFFHVNGKTKEVTVEEQKRTLEGQKK